MTPFNDQEADEVQQLDKEALQIVAKELAPLAFDANNQFDSQEEKAAGEE